MTYSRNDRVSGHKRFGIQPNAEAAVCLEGMYLSHTWPTRGGIV